MCVRSGADEGGAPWQPRGRLATFRTVPGDVSIASSIHWSYGLIGPSGGGLMSVRRGNGVQSVVAADTDGGSPQTVLRWFSVTCVLCLVMAVDNVEGALTGASGGAASPPAEACPQLSGGSQRHRGSAAQQSYTSEMRAPCHACRRRILRSQVTQGTQADTIRPRVLGRCHAWIKPMQGICAQAAHRCIVAAAVWRSYTSEMRAPWHACKRRIFKSQVHRGPGQTLSDPWCSGAAMPG